MIDSKKNAKELEILFSSIPNESTNWLNKVVSENKYKKESFSKELKSFKKISFKKTVSLPIKFTLCFNQDKYFS